MKEGSKFKGLVTISASFLPPEPEGTNDIGKMLLEEICSSLPWKRHALFQALVQGNSHAGPKAQRFGT